MTTEQRLIEITPSQTAGHSHAKHVKNLRSLALTFNSLLKSLIFMSHFAIWPQLMMNTLHTVVSNVTFLSQ